MGERETARARVMLARQDFAGVRTAVAHAQQVCVCVCVCVCVRACTEYIYIIHTYSTYI